MFAFSARRFIQLTSLLFLLCYSVLASATAPSVPASSNGNYTVTWNTYYMFLEEKAGSGSWTMVTQDAPGTKTFSNKPAGSYSYRAVHFSFYPYMQFYYSAVSTTTVMGIPAIPTGLTSPASDTNGAYTVSWNSSNGATSYNLQRKLNSGGWSTIQTGGSTSRAESGLGTGDYSYRVRACSSAGCSSYSAAKITLVLFPPSSFSVPSSSTNTSIPMSWNTVSNATSYKLYRVEPNAQYISHPVNAWIPLTSLIYSGSGTAYSDTVTNSNKTYTFQIKACKGSLCSDLTQKNTAVVLSPPTPGSISVSPVTSYNGTHTISWGSSSGASKYILQQKKGSGGWVTKHNATGTSKALSGLTVSSYQYRVQSCKTYSGVTSCSSWKTSSSYSVAKPLTPTTFTVPGTDNNGAYALSWSAVTGASSYTLQRQTNGGGWSTIQSTSALSKAQSGLGNAAYGYRVRACSATGCSNYTAVKTTNVAITPGVPATISVSPSTSYTGSHSISWAASSGSVTNYQLYQSKNGGGYVLKYTGTSTSRTLSNPSTGSYTYRVRAYKTTGSYTSHSGYRTASAVTVTTPSVPANLNAPSSDGNGAYTVSWNTTTGASSYTLQRQLNGGGWVTIQNTNASSKAESGLGNGTYGYRVRGCSTVGCSSYSTVKTTNVAIAPSVPSSISVNPTTSYTGGHSVSWAAASGSVSGYQLYRKLGSGSYALVYSGGSTSHAASSLAAGSYTYRVRSYKTIGSYTNYSGYRTGSAVSISTPNVPSLSLPSSDSDGSYSVSWGNSAGANSYNLQRALNGGSWSTIYSGASTSRSESSIFDGQYAYRVRACGTVGCSSYSAVKNIDVTVRPTVPATSSTGTYTVTWSAGFGLRERENGGSWVIVQNMGAIGSKTFSGKANGTYEYKAFLFMTSPININIESGIAQVVVDLVPANPPSSFIVPSQANTGDYTLSWNEVDHATSYELHERIGSGSWSVVPNVNGLSKSFFNKGNNTYQYRIRACSSSCSSYSSVKSVSVLHIPGIPSAINAPNMDMNGSYIVSWGASTGAVASYRLQQQINGGNNWATVQDTLDLSRSFANEPDDTYGYRVQGCNASGCSNPTPTATVVVASVLGTPSPASSIDPADESDGDANYKGVLRGNFSVNKTGAANYSVPIEVPPGIQGIQPKLSLSYNSLRKNGLLGWGWAINGLSSISRCPANLVQDGYVDGTNYDDNYKLCLDGQRLVSVGTNEYRTENDGFTKIVKSGSYGNSPGQFTVYRRDGQVLQYGVTSNARRQEQGRADIYQWHLNRITDKAGNYLTVNYHNDTANGDFRPDTIAYTKNGATDLDHSVEFIYEDRDDVLQSYRNGTLQMVSKRLQQVDVKANGQLVRHYKLGYESFDGDAYADPVKTSRINHIEKCLVASVDCNEPVTLAWTSTAIDRYSLEDINTAAGSTVWHETMHAKTMMQNHFADIDGDGYLDLVNAQPKGSQPLTVKFGTEHMALGDGLDHDYYQNLFAQPAVHVANVSDIVYTDTWSYDGGSTNGNGSTTTTIKAASGVIDFNGDGKMDMLVTDKRQLRGVLVYLSNGRTFSYSSAFSIPASEVTFAGSVKVDETTTNSTWSYKLEYRDFNGDGFVDVVRYREYPSCQYCQTLGDSADISVALNNNGAGFGSFQTWFTADNTFRKMINLGDFNGDRLPDLLGYDGRVAINTGSSFSLGGTWSAVSSFRADLANANAFNSGNGDIDVGDFNGDGYSDVVGFYNAGIKIYLSDGKGFNAPELWSTLDVNNSEYRYVLFDVNADNRTDIFFNVAPLGPSITAEGKTFLSRSELVNGQPKNSFVEQAFHINDGSATDSLWTAQVGANVGFNGFEPYTLQPTDINQDGILDWLAPSRIEPHRLLSIDEGGQQLTIDYLPLAQHGLHDMESSNPFGSATSYASQASTLTSGQESLPAQNADLISSSRLAGRYAVARTETNNGVGGNTVKKYHYSGAKFHRGGWGDLGFKTVEVTTELSSSSVVRQVVSEYSQAANDEYRLAGRLLRQRRYATDEQSSTLREISDTANQWQVYLFADTNGGFDEPHYYSLNTDSTTYYDDLNGANRYAESQFTLAYGAALPNDCSSESQTPSITAVTSTSIADSYGNIGQKARIVCDTTGKNISSTKQLYSNQTSTSWVLGLVTSKSLTENIIDTAGSRSLTRNSTASYNAAGFMSSEIREPNNNSLKLTSSYLYNSYGSVSSITESWADPGDDGLGFSSRLTTVDETYDAAGERMIITTHPIASHIDSVVYEPVYGRPVMTMAVNGLTTSSQYDNRGRVTQMIDTDGTQTAIRYRTCSTCDTLNSHASYYVHSKTQGQSAIRTYHDAYDREVGSRTRGFDGTYIYNTTEFDSQGRVERTSLPYFNNDTVRYTVNAYDTLNRLTQKTNPDYSTVTISYNGLEQTTTNELNQSQIRLSNGIGQMISSTDPMLTAVNYRYAPFNTLERTEINGIVTSINYDVLGRKLSIVDPDMGTQSFAYNVLGQAYRETDALGQQTKTEFDRLGRQIKRIDNATASGAGSRTHSWVYDTATNGFGQLASVQGFDTDGRAFTESYAYNANALATVTTTSIAGASYITTQYYDNFSRDDGLVYPTGFAVENNYNNYGYLAKVHKPGEVNNLYWQANSIDALGNATQFLLGNGMLTDQTFNLSTGRVQTIQAFKGNWYAQNHSYTFDALGNLTQRQDLRSGTLTQNFCYDGLNRLKASRFGSCSSNNTDFTYDALGNITSKLGMGNYSYGAGNAGPHAVTNAGGVNYTYDNNGRMLTGDGRTVSYTPFGKPKHMARGSNAVHIAYGPSQNRIERVDTGVKSATTTYVGGLYEKEISGGYTTHTHYLGDFALYIAKSSTSMNEERMVYLHRDHIGSIAAKTDMVATGNANAEFMANGPWGVRTQDKWNGSLLGDNFVPDDTARGFTNHEHLDGVGLVHMNGRVYEPSLGRFLSPDPFVSDPSNSQTFNRYSYVRNNPLSYTDPSGFLEEVVVYAERSGGCSAGATCYSGGSFSVGAFAIPVGQSILQGLAAAGRWVAGAVGAAIGGLIAEAIDDNKSEDDEDSANETERQEDVREESREKNRDALSAQPSNSSSNFPEGPDNDKDKDKLPDNAKDMKELSKGEIKKLKKGGEDIHDLKGKGSSRYDLFKDKNGDVYQVLKGGKGEPQPTNLNIDNF